jgi:hypothetical protein
MWNNFTYFFKRKIQQIKRVIDFLPLIWNGFDFDYTYSIDIFKKQLERTANYLESNRAYGMGAVNRASRIRTAIRLMDKVYEEDYSLQYVNKLEQLYGGNTNQNSEIRRKLFKESIEKQKRAHKLLWRYIEHNIQHWWD